MTFSSPFIKLFKPLFTVLALLTASSNPLHSETALTEVIVVGTVHQNSKEYTSNDLLRIFRIVHPDVILCELDSSFFTAEFNFKRLFGGLEQTAICEYMKTDQVLLRPYDIEGRNEFYRKHDTFNLEDKFYREVRELSKNGKLSPTSHEIFNAMVECFKKRDAYGSATPRRINSFECDQALAEKWYAIDYGYSEIIRQTPGLQAYNKFHLQNRSFELQRNNAMVSNIASHIRTFPGKRILVVCGFEHRHFLRIQLNFMQVPAFAIKEYWEYGNASSSKEQARQD